MSIQLPRLGVLLAFLSGGALAEETPVNQLTAEEAQQGFSLLFDGKSLAGWRTFHQKNALPPWQVEDGAITLKAKGGGDLISEKTFHNFELRLQFSIAAEGNSGIMWRVSEDAPAVSRSSPEYQILDPHSQRDFAHEVAKGNLSGALYDLVPSKPEQSRPSPEWNDAVIRIEGARVSFWLNGHKTVEMDRDSEEWKTKVGASKFATWPWFAKAELGHLAFQDHGCVVRFRSIRLRELP